METIHRKEISMRRLAWLLTAILTFSLAISCAPATPETLDYQVLREWDIPAGGIGMDLLVDESATKEEVLALAAHLREEYSDGYIYIYIFDSLEAHAARETEIRTGHLPSNYSDEEYWKHHLVNIIRNPKTGYDEIQWVAEGRGY